MTFYELYLAYMEYVKVKQKPQSYRVIKSRINAYLMPYFKNMKLKDINCREYFNWQIKIDESQFRYKYKKALHYTMVAMLNFAITFYDLKDNTAVKVGNFKNKCEFDKHVDFWTFEEFSRFIAVVDDIIYSLLFKFLYFTGVRIGEALALNFNDINEDMISIYKTISKEYINGEKAITPPKTKKSIRTIRIDPSLVLAINVIRKHYTTTFDNFNNNFFVFGGLTSLPITTIERKKNIYCKLANVKQIRIHDFRHSHASLLLSNNIPITAISQRLGHSDINLTFNTYIHLMPRDEKRVIETLKKFENSLH